MKTQKEIATALFQQRIKTRGEHNTKVPGKTQKEIERRAFKVARKNTLIELRELGFKYPVIFDAHLSVLSEYKEDIDALGLAYLLPSQNQTRAQGVAALRNEIKRTKKKGILETVTAKVGNNHPKSRKVVTPEIEGFIVSNYLNEAVKPDATEVLHRYRSDIKRLNLNYPKLSKPTIYRCIHKHHDLVRAYRNTEPKNLETPGYFIRPSKPWMLVQMDGTPDSSLAHSGNPKYAEKLNVMKAVECYSDACVGAHVSKSENTVAAINLVMSMVKMYGRIPNEIRIDNSSAFTSDLWCQFGERLKRLGCIITRNRAGNSKGNGIVEGTQNISQQIQMSDPLSFGQGVKTNHRKSTKHEAECYKTKNIPHVVEQNETIYAVINEYNHRSKDGKPSRMEVMQSVAKTEWGGIELNHIQQIDLFWSEKKLTINKGIIKLTLTGHKKPLRYMLKPEEHIDNEGKKVLVKFDEKDLRSVMVFTTDEVPQFLFECHQQPSFHMAKVEQSEHDKNAIKELYEYNKEVKKLRSERLRTIKDQAAPLLNVLTPAGNYMAFTKEQAKARSDYQIMMRIQQEDGNLAGGELTNTELKSEHDYADIAFIKEVDIRKKKLKIISEEK